MKAKMEQRLTALKSELESGQKMLADLQARQVGLRETLLRISGAIQVLEELARDEEPENTATAGEDAAARQPYVVRGGA
jgi:hypothetical protein